MSAIDNIKDELKRIPWWGYVAGAVVLFLAWRYIKSQNATNAAAAQANSGVSGQTGLAGTTGVLDTSGGSSAAGGTLGGTSGGSSLPNSITIQQPSPADIPGPDTTQAAAPAAAPSAPAPAAPVAAPSAPAAPVAPSAPASAPAPAPAPAQNYWYYTVKSGDTLSQIGQRVGVNWNTIYNVNSGQINAVAQQHGFSSSDNGHWIFPGEVFRIPK